MLSSVPKMLVPFSVSVGGTMLTKGFSSGLSNFRWTRFSSRICLLTTLCLSLKTVCGVIPTARHLSNLHFWHWVLVDLSTMHLWPLSQLYDASWFFWMVLRKNPCRWWIFLLSFSWFHQLKLVSPYNPRKWEPCNGIRWLRPHKQHRAGKFFLWSYRPFFPLFLRP